MKFFNYKATQPWRQCGFYEEIVEIPWVPRAERVATFLVHTEYSLATDTWQAFYEPQSMRWRNRVILCDTFGCPNTLPANPWAALWKINLRHDINCHNAFLCGHCAQANEWLNLNGTFDDFGILCAFRRRCRREIVDDTGHIYAGERPGLD